MARGGKPGRPTKPGKPGKPGKPPPVVIVGLNRVLFDTMEVSDVGRDISVTIGTGGPPPPTSPTAAGSLTLSGIAVIASGEVLYGPINFETNQLYTADGYYNSSWDTQPANAAYPSLVASPARGSYAAKHTIPAYGNRCERTTYFRDIVEGDDLWFSHWVYTENVENTSNWQVLGCQWKNHTYGSPPLALGVSNGVWQLTGGGGYPGSQTSEPGYDSNYETRIDLDSHSNGVWFHFVSHIVFSTTPAVSTVNMWLNGTQVLTDLHPVAGTMYPTGDSYMKYGYYRSTSIPTAGYVYMDDMKIGTTAASVGGLGGLEPSALLTPSATLAPKG